MCKKKTQDVTVLKDRTKGLDARGNQALNTQAESNWAIGALKNLDTDAESQTLITDELMRVYYDRKKLGFLQKTASKGFETGFEEYFGKYERDKKAGQLKRVSQPKAEPKPQDLINLMLEDKYKFKDSVSWVADRVAETSPGRELRANARGGAEFQERGRFEGRKRRNSFVGPHAGIADHVFRPEGAENFFTREVEHAKGMFEGKPNSPTYQKFLSQGAPFIGGASGTIEGIALSWEAKEKLDDLDGQEHEAEKKKREKTIGIHMATLLAGGHHSMSEMLIAAKKFGLFDEVTDPLTNYPVAMKELGEHLNALGIPGDLTPKPGDLWLKALAKAQGEIAKIRKEINAILGGKQDDAPPPKIEDRKGKQKLRDDESDDDSNSDDLQLVLDDDVADNSQAKDPNAKTRSLVLDAFGAKIEAGFVKLFPDDMDQTLDAAVAVLSDDNADDNDISGMKQGAAECIKEARQALDGDLITGLDENPFVPVSVRKTLSDVLDQVSSVTN